MKKLIDEVVYFILTTLGLITLGLVFFIYAVFVVGLVAVKKLTGRGDEV